MAHLARKIPLAVSLTSLNQIESLDPRSSFAEFRLDIFDPEEAKPPLLQKALAQLKEKKIKSILTIRTLAENGKAKDDAKRAALIASLAPMFDFADVEYSSKHRQWLLAALNKSSIKTILSAHFPNIPPNPNSLLAAMHSLSPNSVKKLVFMAQAISDNNAPFKLLALAKRRKIDLACFCMGQNGIASRLLAPLSGSALTFGAINPEAITAPGQLVHCDMLDFYSELNLVSVTENTKFLIVLGNPVAHSLSPKMQNAGLKAMGLDMQYSKLRVEPGQLAAVIGMLRSDGFAGANVTVPYKEDVIPLLDSVNPTASEIGAVNAIVHKKGKLVGYNTDVAAVDLLARKMHLAGAKVVLLGAGGASRALVYGLAKAGAEVTILNRTIGKAQELAREFGCIAKPLELGSLAAANKADILINTTTLGMNGESIPYLPAKFNPSLLVFDIVYSPLHTPLIIKAMAECRYLTGDNMLLAQGVKSLELFTGKKVSQAISKGMHNVLLRHLKRSS